MTDPERVFSSGERRLLEARARAVAARVESVQIDAREDLLVVRSGADLYALPSQAVVAVAELTRLSPIPHAGPHVAGLTAFRGSVFLVFHLYAVLGCPASLSEHGRMIVLQERCALAVDVVERLEACGELRAPPSRLGVSADLVQGVTASGIAVLDLKALLQSDRLRVEKNLPSSGRKYDSKR